MDETLFFLHLPRTAGTTLNAVLHDNFAPETILSVYAREDYERCRMLEADALEPIRLIEGHLMPECFDPPSLYGRRLRMFTLLREPLSRLVSEYVFQKSWPGNHLYAYLNENAVSFRDYLTSNDPLLKFRGKNFVTYCLAGVFAPDRNPDEVLALAKKHLEESFCFVRPRTAPAVQRRHAPWAAASKDQIPCRFPPVLLTPSCTGPPGRWVRRLPHTMGTPGCVLSSFYFILVKL